MPMALTLTKTPHLSPTLFQMLSIFLIPSGLTYYLGRMVKNQRHGWAVWSAMAVIFLVGVMVCWWAEAAGNPRLQALGVDAALGKHGRQRGPFRNLQFGLVCHGDH